MKISDEIYHGSRIGLLAAPHRQTWVDFVKINEANFKGKLQTQSRATWCMHDQSERTDNTRKLPLSHNAVPATHCSYEFQNTSNMAWQYRGHWLPNPFLPPKTLDQLPRVVRPNRTECNHASHRPTMATDPGRPFSLKTLIRKTQIRTLNNRTTIISNINRTVSVNINCFIHRNVQSDNQNNVYQKIHVLKHKFHRENKSVSENHVLRCIANIKDTNDSGSEQHFVR